MEGSGDVPREIWEIRGHSEDELGQRSERILPLGGVGVPDRMSTDVKKRLRLTLTITDCVNSKTSGQRYASQESPPRRITTRCWTISDPSASPS